MTITLYRYRIKNASWDVDILSDERLLKIATALSRYPLYGEEDKSKFGILKCDILDGKLYGVFIQKHPKTVTDYDTETKEEIKREVTESGEYFFILDVNKHVYYLQARRSNELPRRKDICRKFMNIFNLSQSSEGYGFKDFEEAEEQIDREKIKKIFYNDAQSVTEIELNDFDQFLIFSEKDARGGIRQTYFNPREEYQEAMEEGAVKFSQHAEKAFVKAKQGESLQKDPLTRAMLESSRKPTKIVYIKENKKFTAHGVTETKVTVSLESDRLDMNDEKQIEAIFANIYGGEVDFGESQGDNNGDDWDNSPF